MSDHKVDSMAYALSSLSERQRTPLHTDEAHRVIAAELVACTLGQRSRLELRTDLSGQLSRIMARINRQVEAVAKVCVAVGAGFAKSVPHDTGTLR